MGFRRYIAMQIAGKKKPPDGVASSTASTWGIMANVNPNSNTSTSQRKKIAAHLLAGNSLTALQALNHFGCARLAARIGELADAGMPIERRWLLVQNCEGKWVRVREYFLAANDAAQAGVVA